KAAAEAEAKAAAEAEAKAAAEAEAKAAAEAEAKAAAEAEAKAEAEAEAARQREAEAQREREAEERRAREEAERQRQAAEAAEAAMQRQLAGEAEAAANAQQAQQAVNNFSNIMRRAVEQAWIIPGGASDGMRAIVNVRLGPSGEVLLATIATSSGDSAFDQSAIQAIEQAAPYSELLQLSEAQQREIRPRITLNFSPGGVR
ncbi:MAG: cell envelope integrity protein TolA, partial [Halomonas sp.]